MSLNESVKSLKDTSAALEEEIDKLGAEIEDLKRTEDDQEKQITELHDKCNSMRSSVVFLNRENSNRLGSIGLLPNISLVPAGLAVLLALYFFWTRFIHLWLPFDFGERTS